MDGMPLVTKIKLENGTEVDVIGWQNLGTYESDGKILTLYAPLLPIFAATPKNISATLAHLYSFDSETRNFIKASPTIFSDLGGSMDDYNLASVASSISTEGISRGAFNPEDLDEGGSYGLRTAIYNYASQVGDDNPLPADALQRLNAVSRYVPSDGRLGLKAGIEGLSQSQIKAGADLRRLQAGLANQLTMAKPEDMQQIIEDTESEFVTPLFQYDPDAALTYISTLKPEVKPRSYAQLADLFSANRYEARQIARTERKTQELQRLFGENIPVTPEQPRQRYYNREKIQLFLQNPENLKKFETSLPQAKRGALETVQKKGTARDYQSEYLANLEKNIATGIIETAPPDLGLTPGGGAGAWSAKKAAEVERWEALVKRARMAESQPQRVVRL